MHIELIMDSVLGRFKRFQFVSGRYLVECQMCNAFFGVAFGWVGEQRRVEIVSSLTDIPDVMVMGMSWMREAVKDESSFIMTEISHGSW